MFLYVFCYPKFYLGVGETEKPFFSKLREIVTKLSAELSNLLNHFYFAVFLLKEWRSIVEKTLWEEWLRLASAPGGKGWFSKIWRVFFNIFRFLFIIHHKLITHTIFFLFFVTKNCFISWKDIFLCELNTHIRFLHSETGTDAKSKPITSQTF